jgi:PPOX class probable F420-dependent enzyme
MTTLQEALEFIRTHHRAVLVTSRGDGRPQVSPVTCAVDADGPDGANRVVVSTRETAMKTKNLRRDPHATLCVVSDEFFGPWAFVSGATEIVSLPEAMDGLIAYYRSVAGEHPDWDEYRAAMERERRVILRITVEDAGPNVSG